MAKLRANLPAIAYGLRDNEIISESRILVKISAYCGILIIPVSITF